MTILTVMEFPLNDLRKHDMINKNANFSEVKEKLEFTQCCPNPRWPPVYNKLEVLVVIL